MSKSKMTLGERVRWLRKDADLNIVQLAKLSGVCQNTISNIERDLFAPNFYVMARIADVFDVSLDWLAGREGWSDGKV